MAPHEGNAGRVEPFRLAVVLPMTGYGVTLPEDRAHVDGSGDRLGGARHPASSR